MQKDPKRANPNAVGDRFVARAIHITGPDDDIRDPEPVAVFLDHFVLLDLRERVGMSA